MPLEEDKLASELEALEPTLVEFEAAETMAEAFNEYFRRAEVSGVVALEAGLTGARAAMLATLTGMSAPGAGAALITAAVTAYWAVVVAAPVAIWPATPGGIVLPGGAIPAPGLAGLALALTGAFAANTAAQLSKEDSMAALAAIWHPTNLGGTVLVQPPGGPPPPPIPTAIE